MLVTERGDEIVGIGQHFPDTYSVEAVHVSPGSANQGTGKMIMNEIETIAKYRGVQS